MQKNFHGSKNVKMATNQNILELRQRLDRTLGLPDLVNEESIRSLVENQLVRSSFSGNEGHLQNVVARRTKEVSNFLQMLRSASDGEIDSYKAHGSSHTDWKIKQDTDQLRVLYREGPYGTPFHSLLTEGYANGSIDVCLCVSWDATLYKKWWPQYNIPTFKITMSSCLQKVRIGEEISLVRMKVPWPVSDREALLHYFEIDYFKKDLVLVLINTISDIEHIDASTHGLTRDGIPEAKDTIRVDLVGGFVLQKVNANGTYFRAIMNMDIKMDFVSPSLINFMSRQLIGSGYKLYQKAVSSVATSDDDYREALKGPMYVRLREGLAANHHHKTVVRLEEEKHTSDITEESTIETLIDEPPAKDNTFFTEIVEEEAEHITQIEQNASANVSPTSAITDQNHPVQKRHPISPEVEHALGILDQAIAMTRGRSFPDIQSGCLSIDQETATLESVAKAVFLTDEKTPSDGTLDKPLAKNTVQSPAESFSCNGGDSNFSGVDSEMASPEEKLKNKQEDITYYSQNKLVEAVVAPVQTTTLNDLKVCDEQSLKVNLSHENGLDSGTNKQNRKKKHRYCCLSMSLTRH